jgi:DNA-binding transcriptional LysR family regulator
VPPRIAVQTSSIVTGLEIVRRGNCFMTAPMQLAAMIAEAGLVIAPPSESFWRFPSGLWVRRSSLRYPVVRFFIEQVKALFAET